MGARFRQWLAEFVSEELATESTPRRTVRHDRGGRRDAANELTPLADYLAGVLRRLRRCPARPGPHPGVRQRAGRGCRAPDPLPAFDPAASTGTRRARGHSLSARLRPARPAVPRRRLNVVGDLAAASWRPARLAPGTCFSVAAGAPLPVAADTVVPPEWTDQGMASVEISQAPKRGYGVRRTGEEIPAGTVLARAGTYVTPAMIAVLAATGVGTVVRPPPGW